uniref:uncharacterized protein LOC120955047 n=1 Tax=Anopheles coluzzii TaxID=1518534 RepID=UPI001AAC5AC6|nr:uncharacterized protein LOC120955047 [Anopheles coluzzii]
MKLIKIALLLYALAGCEALFGIDVSPNIPEAATITNACLRLMIVSQQIVNSVNSVGELSFGTFLLQSGATSFVTSVPQAYTALAAIAREVNTVTNANTGNLNTIFSVVLTNLKSFTAVTIDERFAKWLILQNSAFTPDFSTIIQTLNDVTSFFENTAQPGMLRFSSNRITQATFYGTIPKQTVANVAQKLTDMVVYHESVVLPYFNRFGSTMRWASDKMAQFLSNMDSAFQSIDGTLCSTYERFNELNRTFRSEANDMQPSIQSSVAQFAKRMEEFNDLYVGGSSADYALTANDMYNSYLSTIVQQTKVISNSLETVRNNFSDNALESFGDTLASGFKAMTQSILTILSQATTTNKVACTDQVLHKFISDFSSAARKLSDCFSGSDYDVSAPVSGEITAVKDIQKDVAQYFNQLVSAVGGLANSSPLNARMQLDMFLTAFFSESKTITPTILQQLVNMATDLGANYALLIGRSRYCLAMNKAVAVRLATNFPQATFACVS